ncbi:MAG: hypothetical protein ACXAE3_07880, partial [Candidatus Kariarchaeaceae archaeon]
AVLRGSKRLGFDEIECVVAETARGTSVGFYAVNQLQGLLHAVPYIIALVFAVLSSIESLSPFFLGTGEQSLPFNLPTLLLGKFQLGFISALALILIGALFALTENFVQRMRIDIIKSRFSFYTRDAIWETRDIPLSTIALQSLRSLFHHMWMLAIIYFAIFASTSEALNEMSQLYNSDVEQLYSATIDAFVITGGLVFGLLLSYKSLLLRREYGRFDDRIRISGGLIERRFDPILFGVQSASLGGAILIFFLSLTFLSSASAEQLGLFMFFILLGAAIAGAVYSEGDMWVLAAYAVFVFFTSLVLIFQTGSNPAYAYIVVLQLFFIPIPFVILLSLNFGKILVKRKIRSKDWYFDILPLTSFISLYSSRKKEIESRKAYEDKLAEAIPIEEISEKIRIEKDLLLDTTSNAYKTVRHYFELIFTYTASFEENQFVTIPTIVQMSQWWRGRTGKEFGESETTFMKISDQLLWDPTFLPADGELSSIETTGKEMVLTIQ